MDDLKAPPGGIPSDVADDIGAMVSEGEYIIPANVVRFIGLDKIEKMVRDAEDSLSAMDEEGRIGGEPIEDDSLPFDESELVGYAEGGVVAENTLSQEGGFTGAKQFKDDKGNIMYVPYVNGAPLFPLPGGYSEVKSDVTSEAPNPLENVSQDPNAVKNNKSSYVKGQDKVSPLAGDPEDWNVNDFINYGKQKDDVGAKTIRGIISLMPGGSLALRGRDKFLTPKAASLLDDMIDSGLNPEGQALTQEEKTALVATRMKLAEDVSKDTGLDINPLERASNLITKFKDFVTGTTNSVTQAAPRDTGTSSYKTNPSLDYTSGRDIGHGFLGNEAQQTTNSSGQVTSSSRPLAREGNQSTTATTSDDETSTYKKGGLIARRKKS